MMVLPVNWNEYLQCWSTGHGSSQDEVADYLEFLQHLFKLGWWQVKQSMLHWFEIGTNLFDA